MKDAMTYAHEAGFFSFNVVGWKIEFERLIASIRAEYEAPLKLAEEALNAMLTHMGMDEDEWTKPTFNQAREALAAIREARRAEQSIVLNDPHPPHRLCECTACLEYWTPLPDCDAFAGGGKPIDHIADTGKMVGCAYCDTNLLAGSECSNCGRVTIAEPANTRSTSEYSEPLKQEPVALRKAVADHIEDLRNASPILKENGLIETAEEVLTAADELESALKAAQMQEPVYWQFRRVPRPWTLNNVTECEPQIPDPGYEWRALYAAPVDAKAIRAEALEEAKKACDEICQKAIDSGYTVKGETFIDGFGDGACACAAAIGGLK